VVAEEVDEGEEYPDPFLGEVDASPKRRTKRKHFPTGWWIGDILFG
jgi:hypothetical protein